MPRIGAILISVVALGAIAPGALAATVRVDRSGGLDPQVIFQGGSGPENVSVTRTIPSAGVVVYRFSTTGAGITPGDGCSQDGPTTAECEIQTFRERQGRMFMGGGDDEVFTGAQILILGEGGDDDLRGLAMDGGPGNDGLRAAGTGGSVFLVAPGDGTDTILGGSGFDALGILEPGTLDMGAHANDTITSVEALSGTGGNDTIVGDDRVIAAATGRGWQISGGNGDDRLTAGSPPGGSDVSGGNGEDVVTGGSGPDTLGGGNERDRLSGGAGRDHVSGGDDPDTVDGGAGEDQLFGQNGDDVLRSDDATADTLSCGDGTDRTVADLADAVGSDCELSGEDRDGDALLDEWEEDGFDADGDGAVEVDLAAMGAHPDRKDIFLEIDFMPPHRLEQAAIDAMVRSFAAAPVANPDGSTGIELHVDNGAGSVMDPGSGTLWGARSRQTAIPHQAVIGSFVGDEYQWGGFDLLKSANFDDDRIQIFHYAISGHGHDGTTSGIARGTPGSDLLVTLGAGCQAQRSIDCTLSAQEQAGTLMHELGHGLGLRHGGDDDTPYKPSYVSVMNYAFQLSWLVRTDGSRSLDFSRFGLSMDEAALDETRGFGQSVGSPPAGFLTAGFCPSGTQVVWPLVQSRIDFNCDGAITDPGTVSSDTNGDGDLLAFEPHLDWPELVFHGGAIGAPGRSVPAATTRTEPALEELQESRKALESVLVPPPRATPAPPPLDGTQDSGSGAAGGASGTPGGAAGEPARLSRLRVRPGTVRAARRGPSVVRRGGLRITFHLDRAAGVTFTVQRRRGRRWAPVRGRFTHAGRAGSNALRFSGRLAGRPLRRGQHRLVATPKGGVPARARFSVRG